MSHLQVNGIHSPVTHVSILIKTPKEIFMYEGATTRGTQLRSLEDYVKNSNCNNLYFRQTYVDKKKLSETLLQYSNKHYDWTFLKYILYHMTNIYFIYLFFVGYEKCTGLLQKFLFGYKRESFSCSSLVSNIMYDLGAINPSIDLRAIYPSHFLDYNDNILNPILLGKTISIDLE